MTTRQRLFGAVMALGLLAACGEQDVVLSGERLDIRDGMVGALADEAVAQRAFTMPAVRANADWTHRNGGPEHPGGHLALGGALTQVFAVNIGQGDGRRARITADPVVAGGVIYTLDAGAQVAAVTAAGALAWTRDLTPPTDNTRDASGGGLAVAGDRVLVSTGFGEVSALDAATGALVWTQDLDAPGGAAPTVANGLVYVVARDSRVWALELDSGRIRWQLNGTPGGANFSGGAGAAVTDGIAVFPFPSGEVLAAFPEGGLRRWSTVVTGQRRGRAAATVSDISGDPVIVGDTVYVGNFSGRVAALDIANGDRIWTATEGTTGPVWAAGNSLFMVNDLNELLRLDAGDGTVLWRVSLPQFVEGRTRRQKTLFAHYGPILAGGRLIVASSDGVLRQFNPETGALIGQVALPGGAASAPVVAGQTLYVVNKRGQLLAFR